MQLALLALTGWNATAAGILLGYVGPGIGAGAIAIILGIISSIFLALFAIIWYPVKRLIKGKKAASSAPSAPSAAEASAAETPAAEPTEDGNAK